MKPAQSIGVLAAVAALGLAACTTPPPASTSYPGSYPTSQYPSSPNYPSGQYPPSYPTSQYPAYPDARYAQYGYVDSIEVVQAEQRSNSPVGVGAIGGAIAGGVLGHQVGEGRGNTAATVGGAVIGGIVGNEVEKRVRSNDSTPPLYRFRVRMDDGSYQTFTQDTHQNLRPGDRVRIQDGRVWAS